MSVTLSIDAMGGDHAPRMVIAGINRVVARYPDARFLLFGREPVLTPLLSRFNRVRQVAEVRHADEVVDPVAKPSAALRSGRATSMRHAIEAVACGEAEGVVSAGSTGALMAMAKYVLRTLPGIDRPAIAGVGPTIRGQSVVLDLGANVECDADNLVQFAVMGEVFARKVLGLDKPSIGLLNVGEEQHKGNEAVRQAAAILQASNLDIRFYGFVEGNDIAEGTVDVVVTDGFTGNIALKSMEGTARLFTHILRQALRNSPFGRVGGLIATPALQAMRKRVDPRRYDGAMFLGLNGVCVKSHGGTDAIGFSHAVGVAIKLIADRVNQGIKEDYAKLRGTDPTNVSKQQVINSR
ncbi:MAG: phosphate acyltransferase PlsX [Rhodospirillales bacterium]|nr:MAG: phosphate acyltransferase PlsX [Rhodospirillales bacterium]